MNAKLQSLIQRYMRLVVLESETPANDITTFANIRNQKAKLEKEISSYAIELAVEGRLFFSNRNGKVMPIRIIHNGKVCKIKNPYLHKE